MNKVDVALVSPPFDFSVLNSSPGGASSRAGYYLYYPPEGLCSIAAVLRDAGYVVEIIDGQVDAGDVDVVVSRLKEISPRVVGFGVTTPALPVVCGLVSAVRRELGGALVVVGGPHISCDPTAAISLGADYGIGGDGEMLMKSLVGHIIRGTALDGEQDGLVVVKEKRIFEKPAAVDLAKLPFPARDLLQNPDAYFNPFVKAMTSMALTARGCPFRCSFCCRTQSMGDYRPLPVGRVLQDLSCVQENGAGFVSIIDETFTFDRARALEIVRGMKKAGIKFRWSCQTRADLVDEELLREMRSAGCINMSFGLEAGEEMLRGRLDKSISDEAFENAFRLCRKCGIGVNAFVIIGSPIETREQVEDSIRRVIRLKPDYAVFNIGTLFPGTSEYSRRAESGEVGRDIWDWYMKGEIQLPVLSRTMEREELVGLLKKAYSKFYLRPGFIAGRILGIRSLGDMVVLARQAKTVLSDYVATDR